MRSTITPHPGLHSLYSTGSGGTTTGFRFARTGLAIAFALRFLGARLGLERFTALVRRAAVLLVLDVRAVLVARITSALPGLLWHHRPDSHAVSVAWCY